MILRKTIFVLFINTLWSSIIAVDNVILSAIVWDPRRPIFVCDDPVVHVKLLDQIDLLCPSQQFSPFMADQSDTNTKLYENIYFLGTDKEAYESCNATNGRLLLKCDEGNSKVFNMAFRSFQTSPTSLSFSEGQTYYLIGTGNHTKEYVDNTIGGSCSSTSNKPGYHKLRLKIYICTVKEIKEGSCNVCQSEGCYYKDCSNDCTQWADESIKNVNSNCTMLQKRKCKNTLLGMVVNEFQEVLWPCNEKPPTGVAIIGGSNNNADDADTYKYIAIGLSIICFAFGVFIGAFSHRKHHKKTCSKQETPNNNNVGIPNGIPNNGYKRYSAGDYDFNLKGNKLADFQPSHLASMYSQKTFT